MSLSFIVMILGLTFWKKSIIVAKLGFDYFVDRLKIVGSIFLR